MTKFTHPADAPEGHKWVLGKHPVLAIHEGKDHMIAVCQDSKNPYTIQINKKGETHFGPNVIDAPKEHTVFVNVYRGYPTGFDVQACPNRVLADERASEARVPRIARIKLKFKEGDFE